MEYTIDLKDAKTVWKLHEAVKKGLMLPDYYGMNMDALWDCLTGGDIDTPATIYIKSLDNLPSDIKKEGNVLKQLLHDAKEWYQDIGVDLIIAYI